MKNLKLLGRLQAADMVTLILKANPGERLDYYILAKSINYSLLASGECDGSINGGMRTFNILLSGLLPMLEKGYSFRIAYEDDTLTFTSEDERLKLTPLCVEYNDPSSVKIVDKYQRFVTALQEGETLDTQVVRLENEITDLQHQYNGVSLHHLELEMQSSSPFDEDVGSQKIEDKFGPLIAEKREQLAILQRKVKAFRKVDLKAFKTLALAASRAHEMISFCESYAVVSLKSSFLLQKASCPVMSVQGPLLYQLLNHSNGDGFYWFENSLVYSVGGAERTTVFMEAYLPNTSVDESIVTRGAVSEKYTLSMKGILAVTQLMKSKFPDMTFNMSDGYILLENDKGETITSKFDVENMQSIKLAKSMRGETNIEWTETRLSIPREVQSLLSLFRDQMTVYIKERKVVFQADKLYLVFGR